MTMWITHDLLFLLWLFYIYFLTSSVQMQKITITIELITITSPFTSKWLFIVFCLN